mgnify:CR=1 FL=1
MKIMMDMMLFLLVSHTKLVQKVRFGRNTRFVHCPSHGELVILEVKYHNMAYG